MELVQKYMDLLMPPAIMSKREQAEKQGWSKGTASNGVTAIEFLYRNVSFSTHRVPDPLLLERGRLQYAQGAPTYEVGFEVFFDCDEVYTFFYKYPFPIDVHMEHFELSNASVSTSICSLIGDSDDLIATVTLTVQ